MMSATAYGLPAHYGSAAGHRHGFCHDCCRPLPECRCGCRECRKESKELLAEPTESPDKLSVLPSLDSVAIDASHKRFVRAFMASIDRAEVVEAAAVETAARANLAGTANAFIGGGCCVHLSIEYTAGAAAGLVAAFVTGADGTLVAWAKTTAAGDGYHVKEDIITTKPGAKVVLLVLNATARLRWCEIFSC